MLDRTAGWDAGALPNAASSWIVVNTHAHKERVAIENLERQFYGTYCPMIRTQVRHARKTSQVLRPLFPGYLFVALDLERDRWRPILSTLGVRSVVRDRDTPSRLDPAIIESLKAREVDGAIVRPASPYQVGQDVKIAGGALDGLVVKIIALGEKDRIVVLLDLLNRSIEVRMGASQVRAV
ncbi:Transcriptional activator RfaH [Rhodovulum sp. PH10]|uniref:transcription termination/antitermination protein NusG n=1 Tax=Rhodovulum sp. PH10 TaxID=1187851 RepID=UPI00027C1F29|nr:transcription termination/antitermination NusG family protein [Rhodovulum sp. PH10]EJW09567.1 Transcriptional activator RfaH [Rhodovulum sp. PH10]